MLSNVTGVLLIINYKHLYVKEILKYNDKEIDNNDNNVSLTAFL